MTKSELIAILQTMPADAVVAVLDADTGWLLRGLTVSYEPQEESRPARIVIDGDYSGPLLN